MTQQADSEAHKAILRKVSDYYGAKIRTHGACPEGVDWNDVESQETRFEQLMKVICHPTQLFTINDLGCGYGALIEYLLERGMQFDYRGYDISDDMIRSAGDFWKSKTMKGKNTFRFIHNDRLSVCDYTVASGLFNVKQEINNDLWLSYILDTINDMHNNSKIGFAFNMLTIYSDPPYMKDYLYYADPCYMFDYCKRNYSRNVACLHDYDLYEFTIIVRR